MIIDMSLEQAKLLIAVLVYAEDSAHNNSHLEMRAAIADLREWRTVLLTLYLKAKGEYLRNMGDVS